MKRVMAVVLIAALTTLMVGIDRTSWASQDRDQKEREKQRAAVARNLGEMRRGSTARIERKDGTEIDVVIQEITPDTVIVLRQERGGVVTETITIADIAKIEKTSLKKMGTASKVLIGVAVGLGVLVVAGLAACKSATSYANPRQDIAEATR
jgi:hypothetical protein